MFYDELHLKNLLNLDDWQLIQDSFSDALEVGISTFSLDGELLTRPSRSSRLCRNILSSHPAYEDNCGACLLCKKPKQLVDIENETHFQCHFGQDLYAIPIKAVGNKSIAVVVVGPTILGKRKSNAEYAEDAKKINVSLDKLLDALLEVNVFSYNKIYSMNKMVEHAFSHIAQSAYQKKRLGEMAPEMRQMDPLFARYYEEKILGSLLNACTLALDADSGSVMTLEKKTSMLHIKVSTKLDKAVVENTQIKLGDGLAGLAAATAKPIILPKDENKAILAERMKRSNIKSSMIIPFSKPFTKDSSDVYGVINLNVVRKDRNFSDKDIAFVQELVNLASIALIPIQTVQSTPQK